MTRLIDADLLKENLIKCLKPLEPEEGMIDSDVALLSTLMEIDEQPIAFDMDKVIEQLDNEADKSSTYFEEYADEIGKSEDDDWYYMGLRRAIEIVKGGGIK